MRSLFEYLISKENKKKISFGIKTKFDIKRGDIIETDDGDYFISLERKDISKYIKFDLKRNDALNKYGVLTVQYSDMATHHVWLDLDDYGDDFSPIDTYYKIAAVYIAPHNWKMEYDFKKYTPEFLKNLSKKMTKIEIKS